MKTHHPTLKGITWDHVRGYGPLFASAKPFEEKYNVSILWEKRSLKDFGDASLEALASQYDLIIMDHPHAGTASYTRAVLPLDELLPKHILENASTNSTGPSFRSYWYDNHLWALPVDAACQVASFRSDILSFTNVPTTWDEVFILAAELRERKKFIGMALCPTDCNCSFLTLCAQMGDPFQETNLIQRHTALKALETLRRLFAIVHTDCIHWNPIKLYDHMASQSDVVYCPLAFGYSNYARSGFAPVTLQFASIPGKTNALLGGAGIAISKKCASVEAAAAYVGWLCDEDFQSTVYVNAGGQPAHKRAWQSEYTNGISGNFFRNTLSTIESAYVRPRHASWPQFQEMLGEIIYSFLTKSKDATAAWKEIVEGYRLSEQTMP